MKEPFPLYTFPPESFLGTYNYLCPFPVPACNLTVLLTGIDEKSGYSKNRHKGDSLQILPCHLFLPFAEIDYSLKYITLFLLI